MQYAGVDVDHPRIVEAIKALTKQGKEKAEIQKLVGMPYEVVDRHMRAAREEMKRGK
jgi:hypothetical protein